MVENLDLVRMAESRQQRFIRRGPAVHPVPHLMHLAGETAPGVVPAGLEVLQLARERAAEARPRVFLVAIRHPPLSRLWDSFFAAEEQTYAFRHDSTAHPLPSTSSDPVRRAFILREPEVPGST